MSMTVSPKLALKRIAASSPMEGAGEPAGAVFVLVTLTRSTSAAREGEGRRGERARTGKVFKDVWRKVLTEREGDTHPPQAVLHPRYFF